MKESDKGNVLQSERGKRGRGGGGGEKKKDGNCPRSETTYIIENDKKQIDLYPHRHQSVH